MLLHQTVPAFKAPEPTLNSDHKIDQILFTQKEFINIRRGRCKRIFSKSVNSRYAVDHINGQEYSLFPPTWEECTPQSDDSGFGQWNKDVAVLILSRACHAVA